MFKNAPKCTWVRFACKFDLGKFLLCTDMVGNVHEHTQVILVGDDNFNDFHLTFDVQNCPLNRKFSNFHLHTPLMRNRKKRTLFYLISKQFYNKIHSHESKQHLLFPLILQPFSFFEVTYTQHAFTVSCSGGLLALLLIDQGHLTSIMMMMFVVMMIHIMLITDSVI